MEVVYQKCQSCGSKEMNNILARERGRATMVFVRCAKCDELVARYRLQDYYHHGKGIESFLKSMGASAAESGREQLEEFQRVKEEAVSGFEKALDVLNEREEEKRNGK